MKAVILLAEHADAARAVLQAAGPAQSDTSTMGCILTVSALATIINIVLISEGLSQGPISASRRTLKFQREDMEM